MNARTWGLGILAALTFAALSIVNLDSQGANYDELHQAPASFHYLGKKPSMFTLELLGIPYFNTTYIGAIKSTVYGLYLKHVDPRFTLYSWRLLGIGFVSVGLLVFYGVAGRSLPAPSAWLFAALLTTDATAILTTRFDWGPTALALALRLALLSLWLSIELDDPGKTAEGRYFASGCVVGIAIFEKLSSVVLLVPLALLLLSTWRRNRKGWLASALGLAAGSLPLLLGNISAYSHGKGLISLTDLSSGKARIHLRDWIDYAQQYFATGQGGVVRGFILADDPNPCWAQAETALLSVVLLILIVSAFQSRRTNRLMAAAGLLAAAYVLVGVSVFLLPRGIWVHHWFSGTPFQYAAIALAFAAFDAPPRPGRWRRAVFRISAAAMLILHIAAMLRVEKLLADGSASGVFSPDLTRVGELASRKAASSAFLSADWGTGTQVYCLGDGQDDLVYEPFADPDPEAATLAIADATRKDALYVLATGFPMLRSNASALVLDSMSRSAAWQEEPIEEDFAGLSGIQVRKFVRRRSAAPRRSHPPRPARPQSPRRKSPTLS
jgi:hypothetical protein